MNDYERLAIAYKNTDSKPDKQYSTLPTILSMSGELKEKTILDLGCGSGFFTRAFCDAGAKHIIGIDNSSTQIELAQTESRKKIEYRLGDVLKDPLPSADIANAPYMMNYFRSEREQVSILTKIQRSLNANGIALFVIDAPTGKDLKSYGARKQVIGERIDGALINIELFNESGNGLCKLQSYYIHPTTFEGRLKTAGFSSVKQVAPIISKEGLRAHGADFWDGYLDDTELKYYLCKK